MKIVDIKTILTCPGQNYLFIKVITDDPDIYGIGDASLNGRERDFPYIPCWEEG